IACANPAQLKLLPRARDWQLVSSEDSAPVPVRVAVEPSQHVLSLDLSQTKLPAGEYRLAAKWDWDPFVVEGTARLHPFSDFARAKLSSESNDRLVQGAGIVGVKLTDSDFEFVNKLTLLESRGPVSAEPKELSFTLPRGKNAGEQTSMEAEIDTSALHAGSYR